LISDILLYQIKLEQKVPFLFFFKKRKDIIYRLHYRVDEDRYWFSKSEGNNLCYEHHTKNNVYNSIKILEGIAQRIVYLHSACEYKYEIFDLRKENEFLFELVENVGKDVERLKNNPDEETLKKSSLKGMFLEGR
jgi:hypothetical protein